MPFINKKTECNPFFIKIIAVFFAGLLIFLYSFPVYATEKQRIFYTLRIERLHPDTIDSLIIGKKVTDKIGKYAIGEIFDVSFLPHMVETYSSRDDRMVKVPHPFYRDVSLTILADGNIFDDYCSLGGFKLVTGMTVSFFTPTFSGNGECIAYFKAEEGSNIK